MALIEYRPWWHISRKLSRNPFVSVSLDKIEWCKKCQMDVDVDIEAANTGDVYVYRKRCKRCGGVMQYGVGTKSITSTKQLNWSLIRLMQAGRRFVLERGIDRR